MKPISIAEIEHFIWLKSQSIPHFFWSTKRHAARVSIHPLLPLRSNTQFVHLIIINLNCLLILRKYYATYLYTLKMVLSLLKGQTFGRLIIIFLLIFKFKVRISCPIWRKNIITQFTCNYVYKYWPFISPSRILVISISMIILIC